MKQLTLKLGAAASVAVGAWLMAMPLLASSSVCVDPATTDVVQFHPPKPWGNCGQTEQSTQNPDGTTTWTVTATGGACGGSAVPKGKYCDVQGTGMRCTILPQRTAKLIRSDGRCELLYYDMDKKEWIPAGSTYVDTNPVGPVVDEVCHGGEWYESSETAQIGDCSDTYVG